ncbi:MAG TPA: acyltransferase, partial [Gemmatimonadaceae bacterium]|nr:acyltransferase [Gemmatimonadaceae bacterium]
MPRFRTIDGLRGIAAVGVAVFHFTISVDRAAPNWLPSWLGAIMRHGGYGVDVFFVISGFVIALSVRNGKYTPRYLGRFALRRAIRLDPPYWLTIGFEMMLVGVSVRLFPSLPETLPSIPKILSHLIYAQGILGYGHIIPIF